MIRKIPVLVFALLSTSPVVADSLKDSERMLCVPGSVDHCVSGVACSSESPENENIPEFIEVDLKEKTIAATKASGEDRSTSISSLSREDGFIFLQGMEYGRTFSMVISESTGDLTFVIATDGESATMFGGCTPD